MSKTTNALYDPPSLVRYSAGEQILYPDASALVRNGHHLWSRAGARAPLLTKTLNPFETTSATLTASDDGPDGFDLTRIDTVIQLLRPVVVSGNTRHQLTWRVYGRDFVVRLSVYAPDGATLLTTQDLTRAAAAGWGWSTGTINLTPAEVGDGGVAGAAPRMIGLSLTARRETTKAELWQAWAQEVVATASSYLPTGA
jgi:hypothetical protein